MSGFDWLFCLGFLCTLGGPVSLVFLTLDGWTGMLWWTLGMLTFMFVGLLMIIKSMRLEEEKLVSAQ